MPLKKRGYAVIEAVDVEDAVLKFSANRDRIRLVILDVIMPQKNGKEAFEEIRRLRYDIKVIFMSGYTADILGNNGVLDDGLDFAAKPIMPTGFLKKVREVLDREG